MSLGVTRKPEGWGSSFRESYDQETHFFQKPSNVSRGMPMGSSD